MERVLTASMHTRTFAVNKAVALAAAAAPTPAAAGQPGVGVADSDMLDADTQQTQQQQAAPLKPLNGPSRTSSAAKAAAAVGSGSQAGPKQSQTPAYRPEKLVRTDHRCGLMPAGCSTAVAGVLCSSHAGMPRNNQ